VVVAALVAASAGISAGLAWGLHLLPHSHPAKTVLPVGDSHAAARIDGFTGPAGGRPGRAFDRDMSLDPDTLSTPGSSDPDSFTDFGSSDPDTALDPDTAHEPDASLDPGTSPDPEPGSSRLRGSSGTDPADDPGAQDALAGSSGDPTGPGGARATRPGTGSTAGDGLDTSAPGGIERPRDRGYPDPYRYGDRDREPERSSPGLPSVGQDTMPGLGGLSGR